MIRIVFLGSDSFSLPILRALIDHGQEVERVVGVVTHPDRRAGRGRGAAPHPVRDEAQGAGIPVLQPERVRGASARRAIAELAPDLLVVASFGQILPASLLALPRYGSLNLHPSLLPRLRGPSPIASVILEGAAQTGISLMLMTERMDAGPILAQESLATVPGETEGELRLRLAEAGAHLLLRSLRPWVEGRLTPVPQDESQATYTARITKEDGLIDWQLSAQVLSRQVRAFTPWPSAYTFWAGRQLRVLEAEAVAGESVPGQVQPALERGAVAVGTGEGLLAVRRLQLAGGRVLAAAEVVRGHPDLLGATLGGVA